MKGERKIGMRYERKGREKMEPGKLSKARRRRGRDEQAGRAGSGGLEQME
jgi:hypothetical protein